MAKHLRLVLAMGLLTFAATIDSSGQSGMRFAEMDTNADAVITRREWRGSPRAFDVHDWNGDGILSGDEVRPGARRPAQSRTDTDEFTDWTIRGFTALDQNRDGRVTRGEWQFDMEGFRRADRNGDGALSRAEFTGEQDDRPRGFADDRGPFADANNDGRISRAEWRGTDERFNALDTNRDGELTSAELRGESEPPPDLFTSVDVNRDGVITRNEWEWSRAAFDRRDRNRDGRLSREEFGDAEPQSEAWRQGRVRGLVEGRQAGREDRERNQGWDLEGQRELETADSGYQAQYGSRADYQDGYRDGFRQGYREGWGPR